MGQSNSILPTSTTAALLLTQVSAAATEANILDDILRKITKPEQGEEIYLYAAIAVCILFAYILYGQLIAKKKEDVDQLTFDTLVRDSPSASTKADDDDEQGEQKLLQALDKNQAQFELELTGNLTKEGFFRLRNMITAYAQEEFKPKKEELMQLRLKAYQEQDWQNYLKYIGLAAQAFQQIMQERTLGAINHLNISQQTYGMSAQIAMQDPQMQARIQTHDTQLAKRLDTKDRKFVESKEEIKAILMEKVKLEGELQLKLMVTQAPSPEAAQQIAMMERTKVMDSIYLKHGMKINFLLAIATHHGLQDDADIRTLEQSYRMQADQRLKKTQEMQKLSEEDEKVVDDALKHLNLTTAVQLDVRGLIPFEQLLKIQSALTKISVDLRNPTEKDFQIKRRELLKSGQEEAYNNFIRERQQLFKMKTMSMSKAVMQKLGLNEIAWPQNMQYYMQNETQKQLFQQAQQNTLKEIEAAMIPDQQTKVLSKQDTLDYIRKMELKKFETIKMIQNEAKTRMIDQMEAQMLMEREKMKAFDRLFIEVGAAEEEIAKAMKEYELEKSPEFQAIINEMNNRMRQEAGM